MRKMPLNLMILTSYFAIEPKNIRGGIGYRYVGLYGSLVKTLLKRSPKSKVFWYSHSDQSLRLFHSKKIAKYRTGMLKAVLHATLSTLKGGGRLAVIIAYPYAVPKVNAVFYYIFSLLVLKSFGLGCVKIIVDDFDPPVEAAYAFSETKPSMLSVVYGRTLEMLTLKLSSLIIVITESYKQHIAKVYHVNEEKIFVLTNGALVRLIPCVLPKIGLPFRVLYSGSAMKCKDVDKLVKVIDSLRKRGLNIELHVAGSKLMDLPDWVKFTQCNWPAFVKHLLSHSDIGVIPYPPNKLHFSLTMPTKPFDYMAAGKPIISTNLKETGNIVRTFNCGLVAKDWKEYERHIERLYQDRELAKELGRNGRKAAEKYFNYELLAEALLNKLIKTFKNGN
jgi:glycosyltransferase involved in cell wall biosynthesis